MMFIQTFFMANGHLASLSTCWTLLNRFVDVGAVEVAFLSANTSGILPAKIFDFLKPLRYVLHCSPDFYRRETSTDFPAGVVQLIARIRKGLPRSKMPSVPSTGLRLTSPVKSSLPDLMTRLKNLTFLSVADHKRVLEVITQCAENELLSAIDHPSIETVLHAIGESNFSAFPNSPNLFLHQSTQCEYITAAPGSGGVGHNAFLEITLRGLADYKATGNICATAFLVCNLTFCRPEELSTLFFNSEGTLIGRINEAFDQHPQDAEMHRQAQNIYWFPAPAELGDALRLLQTQDSFPSEAEINGYLASISPRYETLSRVRTYQLFHGCEWSGYGPILPRCGLFASIGKPDVSRTYVHLSGKLFRGYVSWLQLFFPSFRPDLTAIPKGGSARCANLRMVKRMRATLSKLTTHPLPSSLDECIVQFNAVVALVHLLAVVFLGGCRNYPSTMPWFLIQNGGWILNYEKQLFGFHFPIPSLRIFDEFLAFKEIVAAHLCTQRVDISCFQEAVYAPLHLKKGSILTLLDVNCAGLRESLLEHPSTWKFALFDRNALRHLSMTALYRSGKFSHHDIECFHQRSLLRLTPLGSGSLSDTLHRRVREDCAHWLDRLSR